jgi:nifR3 family TIM-barrel protein
LFLIIEINMFMKKCQGDENFWQKLKNSARGGQAIYALAPMAGVTDSAFRQMCKSLGADVVYSEMASAAALVYQPAKTLAMLKFSPKERPYVVQLFGSKPEHFSQAVKLVEKKIKPDGIDINFGCPVKKVAKQGAGAVLMDNPKLARLIVEATINNTSLPVSIKVRSQVGRTTVLDFLKYLADLDIKAVMIHGRTLAQGHSGPVNCEIIRRARDYFGGVILANGGVRSVLDARDLLKKTQADGLAIGQGSLGKPWVFKQLRITNYELRIKNAEGKSAVDIFKIMLEHAKLAEKLKGKQGIIEMRKHLCWYVNGMKNASELRRELMKVGSMGDINNILKSQIPNSKSQTNPKL